MENKKIALETGEKGSWLKYLLLSAAVVTYLLIVAGNVVRVSGSSLACPDWPTCFGQWGLPDSLEAQIQYAHRVLALVSTILVVASAGFAGWKYRLQSWIFWPLVGAVLSISLDAALGAGQVLRIPGFDRLQAVHTGLALVTLGLVLTALLAAFILERDPVRLLRISLRRPFSQLVFAILAATFVVMVSGIFVTNLGGAATACAGWPLCNGRWIPGNGFEAVQMGHRLLTGLTGLAAVSMFLQAWRSQRTQRLVLPAASVAAVLFFGQVLVGALKVSRDFPLDLVGLHAASSAAVWAALVILAAAAGFSGQTSPLPGLHNRLEQEEALPALRWGERIRDMLVLTKPIIVILLLITTYAGMVVGGRGFPPLGITAWTLLAGAMAAGGSGAVNQYIDRDLDRRMQRTAKRPLAAGRMTPAEGLAFGLTLLFGSFYLMAGFVNLLAALLSLAGMIYYVLLYSILLKKATIQNIVIGGGAGAIPPLVGWAAAAGRLDIPAIFLFAIIFFWTPPHFWALALVRRNDYARAGIPMLPVVRGEQVTRVQIFVYTLELVGLTLLMPVLKMAGSVFLVSALVLGGALIFQAWRVLRQGGNKTAWMMYRYSSMYLALIFAALVLDVFF